MTLMDVALGGGSIADMCFGRFVQTPTWDAPVPECLPRIEPEPEAAAASSDRPAIAKPKLQYSSMRAHPAEEEANSRASALKSWVDIVSALKGSSTAFVEMKGQVDADLLEPYMATKRTGTLAVRASSWRLFLKWAADTNADLEAFGEPMVFAYLKHLKEIGAPPSRGDTFLRGSNFAFGVIGLTHGHQAAISSRCRGLAAVSMAEKRRRIQRDPLQMQWVMEAEEQMELAAAGLGLLELHEACVLGFLLFALHSRSRNTDAARIIDEPKLDVCEGPGRELCSFIESVTTGDACKTGNTSKKARLAIPVTGLAFGVSGKPWAESWLKIRKDLCMDASKDQCLMREPLANGLFTAARIKAGQATQWLRHILLKLGVDAYDLRNIGSHSLKTTLLSVAAKGGLSRDTRRTLGGHATPGDDSVDTYSRDILAAPMLELAKLLDHVRAGRFEPDMTRSGRWQMSSLTGFYAPSRCCSHCDLSLAGQRIAACDCGNFFHTDSGCSRLCGACNAEFCTKCTALDNHVCRPILAPAPILEEESDDSLATDNDSDGEVAAMAIAETEDVFVEACSQSRFLEKGISMGDDALVPEAGVFLNRITGTAHLTHASNNQKSACGIYMNPLGFEYSTSECALLGTTLCWRAGCANWVARPVEEESNETPEGLEDEAWLSTLDGELSTLDV